NKANVALKPFSGNATFFDDLVVAPTGLQDFQVIPFGTTDTVNINATPSGVTTDVRVESLHDQVNLRANSGAVNIFGNGTGVAVNLGSDGAHPSQSRTSRINANVSVFQPGQLVIANGGGTGQEEIDVTASTISGTSLFENNNVVVQYLAAP